MPKDAEARPEPSRILPAIAHEVFRAFLHGQTLSAIARQFSIDPRTAKKYIDALLKEQQPARRVSRDRLRQEMLAKLRRIYQHTWELIEADPGNTAALNVLVRTLREQAKLQGLYADDVTVAVEHKGDVTIHVVYKNDWRGIAQPAPVIEAEFVEAGTTHAD